jgi:uncharacterized phage protein gp47/JayE
MPFQKPGFPEIYGALESDLRRRAPALSDWEEGSVVRSLFESFAVEMATLYEQMDLVYQAGYVDTATGPSLDRVVAVLGITRNEPDFATGTATFERDPGAAAEVVVPAGTLLTTRDAPDETPPRKAYVTTEEVRLAPGQATVDARIQAEERGSAMTTGAETVVVMPRPVPGVKSVRNRRPVRFLGRDREGDDELRDRARKALLASGRASATAIENALLGLPGVRGVRLAEEFPTVRVQDSGGEPLEEGGEPAAAGEGMGRGVVKVYVDGLTAANAERLRARVDEVRAAGVFVVMEPAVPISVQALLRIEPDPAVRGAEALALLERRAEEAVGRWLDRQRMGEPLLFSRLTGEVLAVEGVADLPDFRVVTFREGRAFATGEVVLSRPAELAAAPLPVPSATELRTATGRRFQTAADALLEAGETEATVPVRALRMGREGELRRTGSAVEWRTVEAGGTTLAVRNPAPVLLPRVVHEPADRRVEAGVEERFVAERIRVAAGEKTLQVHVRLSVTLPGPAGGGLPGTLDGETRAAVEEAVRGYAREAADREPPRIEEGEVRDRVEAVLDAAAGSSYELGVRIRTVASDGEVHPDQPYVEPGFLERAVLASVFVHTRTLPLTGTLPLTLPLTATAAEREQTRADVRQALAAYLDELGPEEPVMLERLRDAAAGLPGVVEAGVFVPGPSLAERVEKGKALRVEPQERVVLDPSALALEG